jgi:20S proteasome subunit beta 2
MSSGLENKEGPLDAFSILQSEKGGFDFGLAKRNAFLERTGMTAPKGHKTGTTICGVIYKDGVVLAADTRATSGSIVCDKNCEKIHHITKHIWCCGAGTAADTEAVTGMISSQLELHRLATKAAPRVKTAVTRLKQHLFKYQGHVSAALVLGGVDPTGSYLYTIHPHGSVDQLPFATMGSGSLAAMAVMEANYKDDMTEQEAIDICDQAIQAGIWNDLGSGSNVDICVISKDAQKSGQSVKMLRNYRTPNERLYKRKAGYVFPRGTTEIISQAKEIFRNSIEVESKPIDEMSA